MTQSTELLCADDDVDGTRSMTANPCLLGEVQKLTWKYPMNQTQNIWHFTFHNTYGARRGEMEDKKNRFIHA